MASVNALLDFFLNPQNDYKIEMLSYKLDFVSLMVYQIEDIYNFLRKLRIFFPVEIHPTEV